MPPTLTDNTLPPDAANLTETQRFWFAHVQHCLESGLSIAAYARQHQLADKSLYHWIKRKREWSQGVMQTSAGSAIFHRVQLAKPVTSHSSERPALWLRLPNGIECEWRFIEPSDCLEVLAGLSRLPT